MTRLIEAIRPHPHRGDLIAAGALPLTVAVLVADARMQESWPSGVLLAMLAATCALVLGMAVLAPLEAQAPRAYHSVLLVSGLALLLGALARLGEAIGASGDLLGSSARLTWTLGILAAAAIVCAVRAHSAVCTLIGALSGGSALLAAIDWIFGVSAPGTFRWLLLGLAVLFGLRSLPLRDRQPRHALALIDAAGLALLAIALISFSDGAIPFTRDGVSGSSASWGWEAVVLVGGLGLIAYGSSDREPGPAYIGTACLLAFIALAAGGDSLLGWPLFLAVVSVIGLGLGLRPRRELPPAPDSQHPVAETLPLPGPKPPGGPERP